jgi:hypothetical protein
MSHQLSQHGMKESIKVLGKTEFVFEKLKVCIKGLVGTFKKKLEANLLLIYL